MFCAPGLVFQRYQGRRVPFSCFVLPDSFLVVPRVSYPIFMFSALGHVFGSTEGVRSLFHVLRFRTCFRRFRGRQFPFSCFALPDSFSAVPSASGAVVMFCAPGLISTVPGSSSLIFMFCATGLVFDGTEGVGSRFHVFPSRTRFRWYRGRPITFSCFPLPDMFSTVQRASGPFFTFCALGLIFGGTEGVGCLFHVLRTQTHFWWYRGCRVPFSSFACWTSFRLHRGRQIPFSYFVLPDLFSAVLSASGPVFMFCAPGLVLGGTECVESHFHVLRYRTRFQLYQGRRVPFSCIALME
jgi:hypothetical protein